ncbi:exopolysaccharide biosynthesis protein [Caldimonas tepidiphila]|uniref:exopolysaccharide biosynthesis protein n=1 Tax=Caldimonas tepidiphila TaxID=2315841 RepID=UPI000E5AB7CA|nr:exopolysaccharide biosynthesis protein [Caldimonas tepidiphila]
MSKRLAAVFRRAARHRARSVLAAPGLTLPDLLALHGQASAAVLLLLLAMLSAAPLVGLGSVLGFVILALAWRWHRDWDAACIPERLHRVALSETWSRRCLQALAWTYAAASRFLAARWLLLCHRSTHPWWGGWIALMGALILLPLPLGNVLPSLSLALLSLGWMFRDGRALLLSALVGVAAVGYAFAMGQVLVEGAQAVLAWLGLRH